MTRGRWGIMLVMLLVAVSGCATVQPQTAPTGTLDKLTTTRKIALGYRESSVPFSSASAGATPAGYSVELCTHIVADLQRQVPNLQVTWVPVTVENRIRPCSRAPSTSSAARLPTRSRPGAGGLQPDHVSHRWKPLALAQAPVGADLRSIRIAVIPGTTTEQVLKAAVAQSGAAVQFIAVPDHAEGLAALERQTADAYASDRIILIGLALAAPNPARFALADQYFSYEPYALMLRRGDPAFRLAVNRALARLYRSGQILEVYNRWFGRLGPPSALMLSLYAIEGLPE